MIVREDLRLPPTLRAYIALNIRALLMKKDRRFVGFDAACRVGPSGIGCPTIYIACVHRIVCIDPSIHPTIHPYIHTSIHPPHCSYMYIYIYVYLCREREREREGEREGEGEGHR